MNRVMLDLELLRSFVSVIDAGGFTRAGERVHRTQSTVSQQIRRLEEDFGRPLLHRDGKRIRPTEEGERLLSYARRILALAEEARDVVSRPSGDGVVRLGLPEDFAAYRLTEMLSEFARSRPGLRLYVRCGKSDRMRRALERGEIDLALFKRDAEETGGIAARCLSRARRQHSARGRHSCRAFGAGCWEWFSAHHRYRSRTRCSAGSEHGQPATCGGSG